MNRLSAALGGGPLRAAVALCCGVEVLAQGQDGGKQVLRVAQERPL